MDRFIAAQQIEQMTVSDSLKSNMDRFIVNLNCDVVLSDVL